MYLIEFVHNKKTSCHYLHLQHYCHAHDIKATIFQDEYVLLLLINDINFRINSPIWKSKYVVKFPFNRLFKNHFFSYIIFEIIPLYHNYNMTEILSYFFYYWLIKHHLILPSGHLVEYFLFMNFFWVFQVINDTLQQFYYIWVKIKCLDWIS